MIWLICVLKYSRSLINCNVLTNFNSKICLVFSMVRLIARTAELARIEHDGRGFVVVVFFLYSSIVANEVIGETMVDLVSSLLFRNVSKKRVLIECMRYEMASCSLIKPDLNHGTIISMYVGDFTNSLYVLRL